MDFEQDYLMRMIKQMVKSIIKILGGKSFSEDELPLEEQYQASEGSYRKLLELVNDGKINEAENMLYDIIDYTKKDDICMAVSFYGYLNGLDDEFLKNNDFSREEVHLGLQRIAKKTGIESVIEAFKE